MKQLADTSAWIVSRRREELREQFELSLSEDRLAICDAVCLELLQSARNARDFRQRRRDLAKLTDCAIDKKVWQRAIDVYQALAEQGGAHQRSVKHADLLIAAAAELAGFGVLHYDEDFDRIAKITGQPVNWIAPRGSI